MPTTKNSMTQHYLAQKNQLLSALLREEFGKSDDEIATFLRLGAIYKNNKRVLADCDLLPEDYLRFHFLPRRYPTDHDLSKVIVFEDAEFCIVNKPSGIPVHPTLDNVCENLLTLLQQQGEYHITQRLDLETSGLMVYAKTKDSQREFNFILSGRKIHKSYRAITERPLPLGRHVHFMEKSPRAPKIIVDAATAEKNPENYLQCDLEILSISSLENNFSLKILLHTGRSHQIRAQLSFLGAPICGDIAYGGSKSAFFGLQSQELRFTYKDKDYHFTLEEPT